MNVRERVFTVLEGDMPDRIPQLTYSNFLPRGTFERKLRNMGLGFDMRCSVHRSETPNVRRETNTVGDLEHNRIITPMGTLEWKRRINMIFQNPGGSWRVEHCVKRPEDLEILKFVIEDTEYLPDYDGFVEIDRELAGDGVVTVSGAYTPLMRVIVEFTGFKNYVVISRREPRAIEEVLDLLDRRYLEMYKIISESPAEIVRMGDNIDEVLVPPKIFERYCLPYYNRYARILRRGGKRAISHMDGRLRSLKDLIGMTELDAIEAFTPPPTGNLPLPEARSAWPGKALWLNFPQAIFFREREGIAEYTLEMLEDMGDGSGYIIGMTEDIHPDHYRKGMLALTEIIQTHGKLPLEFR